MFKHSALLALLVAALLMASSPAALYAQATDEEPELGSPEWSERYMLSLTSTSLGVRVGGKPFDHLNAALRSVGYAGVDPTLWALGTNYGTLIKSKLYFGFSFALLFNQVKKANGYESYVPLLDEPFSALSLDVQLGYNVLHRSQRLRLMPMLGVGWAYTRAAVDAEAGTLPSATFGQGLSSPAPSIRLRTSYWYATPQVALQYAFKPERKAAFFVEARVGYLIAQDRSWNDRTGRLTGAPSDNPSGVQLSLGVGVQLRGKPRNAISEAMGSIEAK